MRHRIGIIGAGAIARDHVQALRMFPDVEIAHVVDRHADRAEHLARGAGGATWSTDPATLLTDASIDAVDICTAPDSHAYYTIAAAEYGKAILLEKPVALSMAEVDRMLDAVSRAGVSFLVGQTSRFQPVNMEVSSAVRSGEIGTLRALHLSWYAGHVWPGGWRAWQMDMERCGGHLLHNGVHAIDYAVSLFDRQPVRVFARGFTSFSPQMPTPDSFHIIVRFDDGGMAMLEWSYALRQRGDFLRRIVAIGESGTIHHSTEGEREVYSDAARPVAMGTLGAFDEQMRHWVDVLNGDATPAVTPEHVRGAIAAALAAQESYVTGRAITIASAEVLQ